MQNSPFTVVDFISLTPNKCVLYPRFFRNKSVSENHHKPVQIIAQALSDLDLWKQLELFHQDIVSPFKQLQDPVIKKASVMPVSNSHNFELSKTAQKNLREKVTWLYHFSKKKTIVTRKGKQLTNFKMNFATLKLPSEQIHSSDFITKNCLNQLFVEISKKYDFKNYVWRLEYQKNGNLHYHIATDTYIDFHFLNWTWNRILNKYGYVDLYTRKFTAMDFATYRKNATKNTDIEFSVLQERYAKGCREGWKNPNTVDVKAVFGANNIAYYISKYMAKTKADEGAISLPVCELNSGNSRLWFCSRSLSKCERISDAREALEIDLYGTLLRSEGIVHKIFDYCIVVYFDFSKLSAIAKAVVRKMLELYRQEVSYVPCG